MAPDELQTPCLVVDLDRLERNLRSWQDAVTAHGVRFRPHIKTHKTLEIARMQLAAGAAGITTAKVSEAELYVDAGFDDVVVAYPVVAEQACARLARLAARARIGVNVENHAAAQRLSSAAVARGAELGVFVDLDTGLGRCGVPAGDPALVDALADRVRGLPGLRLRGITSYRGISYAGGDGDAAASGREEGETVVAPRAAGPGRGGGRQHAHRPRGCRGAGVTEVRAGTYVFNDLMQLGNGSAQPQDVALSILTTVVSNNREGRVTVDGGSKTFSGDVVLDDGGRMVARSVDGSIVLDGLTEEHGVGRTSRPVAVGERIAFHPAHVCTTVNLSDQLFAGARRPGRGGWPVAARGRVLSALLSRDLHRAHDARVVGAAAEVAGQRQADLVFVGRWLRSSSAFARSACRGCRIALDAALVEKGLLQRVQLTVGAGQALDGDDLAAVGLQRQVAGVDRLAVQQHHAGAALGVVAALLGAGQPDLAAQHRQRFRPGSISTG
jgi:D-serine deaminase-like pyridoxal phosphate-dependent protein